MIGQVISHYKVLEKLGEGGMGVVYKAEDLKLKRTVAIKFLPKKLSVHGEERERFTHEAQAASSLNHPNICTIHEIDEADDDTFIVMEFIEGITLREWIQMKAEQQEGYRKLAVKEAVEIATQIAEGLEKAHEKGIVHRDIKSENIMVSKDGRAKIMDFGLAKLRGVSKLTKIGSTVGTIAYMSPEQVEGIETDHRTDIFSFGVVLYEMLTGQLPFRAEHETAMMYEIINVEPPSLLDLRRGLDAEVDRIGMKCLEKNREERYQSMREVSVDLKRHKKASEGKRITRPISAVTLEEGIQTPETPGQKEPKQKKFKTLVLVIGGAIAALIIAGLMYLMKQFPQGGTKVGESKITKVTSRPGLEDEPTWSPDGKFLAYTSDDRGNFDIIVQPLTGGQPIRVVDSDADDGQPAWSPDGAKLAFVSARDRGGRFSILIGQGLLEIYLKGKGGDIFLVPALGGTPVKLVENGFDPAWSPDGKTIVFRSIRGGHQGLWTVPAEGGTPKQLTNDPEFEHQPSWSPDGKWILYGSTLSRSYASTSDIGEIGIIPKSGGSPKYLTNDKAMVVKPAWSPDGKFILFSSNRSGSMNVWKMPFKPDVEKFETPVRVTVGEGDDINISVGSAGNTIAFATVKSSPDIWELTVSSGKIRQVSSETGGEDNPHLSRDGKTLLVISDRRGSGQLWTMDLDGNFLAQLTSDEVLGFSSGWSPDGKDVMYEGSERGKNVAIIRALGEVSPRKIIDNARLSAWSPDGKKIAFVRLNGSKHDIWVHWLDTGEEKQLTSIEWNCVFPSWSSDGDWIAFNVDRENTREIWLIPSSGGPPKKILAGEAEYSHPQWSPLDKDALVCLEDHKNIVLVSVTTGKIKQISNFTESGINLIDYPTWSPDGKKIYFSLFKKTGDVYTLENY